MFVLSKQILNTIKASHSKGAMRERCVVTREERKRSESVSVEHKATIDEGWARGKSARGQSRAKIGFPSFWLKRKVRVRISGWASQNFPTIILKFLGGKKLYNTFKTFLNFFLQDFFLPFVPQSKHWKIFNFPKIFSFQDTFQGTIKPLIK